MTPAAQALLSRAQSHDPDAAAQAGVAALNAGLEEEALPLLERAARAHADDARLFQVLALLHRALEDLAPAVSAFARAAELAPDDALIAHGHARATLEAGLPATGLFERALRLAPTDGGILLGRAAAQVAEGRLDAAIASLEAVVARNPGWVDGHSTVARLRWMAGDRERSTRSFDLALASAPRNASLWRGLIDLLLQAERPDNALTAVRRARTAAGALPLFDAYEAVAADEAGLGEEADVLFARLGPPPDIATAVRHVRHHLRRGRPERALAIAEPLAPRAGGELWPYLSIGWRLTDDPRWKWLEGDPRLVGVYDIADRLPPLDRLAETLRALHVIPDQPLEQSVRGGTQTDGPLFSRIEPEIRALRSAVSEAVEAHLAQLPQAPEGHPSLGHLSRAPRFTGSWSVRLSGGGLHSNHVHPAGWFSSALYVVVPEADQCGDPPAGWLSLGRPQETLGLDLPAFRTVEPKPGRLVLFPSTMWHGTVLFEEGERLTVAFDVARPRT
jgi:tetratricopeptide (TPR) repeat protein